MATDSRGLNLVVRIAAALLAAATLLSDASRTCAADRFGDYDLMMFDRPKLLFGTSEEIFQDGLQELWLRALERPDPSLRRMVIDTLGQAHRLGLPGVVDTESRLVELAEDPEQELSVLVAIANTLVVFEAEQRSELLAKLATRHGASVAEIVEPALAAWKSPALRERWLQRIDEATSGPSMLAYAMRGMASLQDSEANDPLKKIVTNAAQPLGNRIVAAQSLGRINETGLVEFAAELLDQPARHVELNALLAIETMSRHAGEEAVELLTRQLDHPRTAVQARALGRLYEIDFRLVDRHVDRLLESPDANVRRVCLNAMVDVAETPRIKQIASLLDDVNPSLRRSAAASLVTLAGVAKLKDEVLDRVGEMLDQQSWRGCEQACVVMTRLDHKPSGPRMVELLGHERSEVQVASAWGLTRLRVERLLPDMLDHAESVYQRFRNDELSDSDEAQMHIAHLFLAFGDQKYREADSLLRKYVPKDSSLGIEARAAAAWALGMIFEGEPEDVELAKMLMERVADIYSADPETSEMQQMSAVSLGRMKTESQLGGLRKFARPIDPGGVACYWALEQITGEKAPVAKHRIDTIGTWFLQPVAEYEETP